MDVKIGVLSRWTWINHMSPLSLVTDSNWRQRKSERSKAWEGFNVSSLALKKPHGKEVGDLQDLRVSPGWQAAENQGLQNLPGWKNLFFHDHMSFKEDSKFQMRLKPGWYHGFILVRPQEKTQLSPLRVLTSRTVNNKETSFDLLSMQCKNRKLIQFS